MTTGSLRSIAPGTMVAERYEIKKELGRGSFGVVFLATNEASGREVALKVFSPDITTTDDAERSFRREVEAAQSFVHRLAVQIRDVGRDERLGAFYFSMDLVVGTTLAEVLRLERRLPPERAVAIGSQVLEALEEAHAAGIVHRDLKPANLMIARNVQGREEVRVLDFGIARAITASKNATVHLASTGSVVGTLAYMSPEQANGKRLDGRSDLYSVGVILYEALSGFRPIEADGDADDRSRSQLTNLLNQTPRPLSEVAPGVSSSLGAAVDRALSKRPEERFATAREFREALARAAGLDDFPATIRQAVVARPSPTGRFACWLTRAYPLLFLEDFLRPLIRTALKFFLWPLAAIAIPLELLQEAYGNVSDLPSVRAAIARKQNDRLEEIRAEERAYRTVLGNWWWVTSWFFLILRGVFWVLDRAFSIAFMFVFTVLTITCVILYLPVRLILTILLFLPSRLLPIDRWLNQMTRGIPTKEHFYALYIDPTVLPVLGISSFVRR